MRAIEGLQSHNRKELEKLLNASKYKKQYKIIVVPKPKWWYGKWKKLYEIKKRY